MPEPVAVGQFDLGHTDVEPLIAVQRAIGDHLPSHGLTPGLLLAFGTRSAYVSQPPEPNVGIIRYANHGAGGVPYAGGHS